MHVDKSIRRPCLDTDHLRGKVNVQAIYNSVLNAYYSVRPDTEQRPRDKSLCAGHSERLGSDILWRRHRKMIPRNFKYINLCGNYVDKSLRYQPFEHFALNIYSEIL
jgi:hypothetical protein